MIAKRVKRSKGTSDFGRLVNYLLDTKYDPELLHETPAFYTGYAADEEERKVAWFELSNCYSDVPSHLIAEVNVTQEQNKRSKNDKTYHLVVSFPEGEQPSREIIRNIEQRLCEGVGLGDHQRLLVVHRDTEHFHMHIAINKVHPETLRCVEPYYDHYKLNDLCRELEREYGLQRDNGIERDKERDSAREMEAHTGEQSLLSWLKAHVKDELLQTIDKAQSWQAVHDVLGRHGLIIKPRGAGLVIGDSEKDVFIKASNLNRKLSMKSLTEQLGPYVDSTKAIERDPDRFSYEPGPKQAHSAAKALYAQYQAEQKERKQNRWNEMQRLRNEHRDYVSNLKNWYDRQYKNLRYSLFLTPADKKARYKYLSKQRKIGMAEQRELYASSKRAIMTQTRCQTWTAYLKEQAEKGNEKALDVIHNRQQSFEREQIRAEDEVFNRTLSAMQSANTVYQMEQKLYSLVPKSERHHFEQDKQYCDLAGQERQTAIELRQAQRSLDDSTSRLEYSQRRIEDWKADNPIRTWLDGRGLKTDKNLEKLRAEREHYKTEHEKGVKEVFQLEKTHADLPRKLAERENELRPKVEKKIERQQARFEQAKELAREIKPQIRELEKELDKDRGMER